jgi:uncharacterized protein with PQ loop repeat
MAPDAKIAVRRGPHATDPMRKALAAMSVFTMVMTVPQVLTIWVSRQAAGVSLLSWGAYLLSALLWFWYGVRERDKNIYMACVGWIVLDALVIAGAVYYG